VFDSLFGLAKHPDHQYQPADPREAVEPGRRSHAPRRPWLTILGHCAIEPGFRIERNSAIGPIRADAFPSLWWKLAFKFLG